MVTANVSSGAWLMKLQCVQKNQGLSEEQVQHLIAARSFCLATLSSLMRERHSMSKTLQVSAISHGATRQTLHPLACCLA